MPVAVKLWRVSNTLGPRSQGRQAAFSGELASPPPTEPSLIEWESIYCTSHIHPCFICRWRENCPAWKVLVPTSAFMSRLPKSGNGLVQSTNAGNPVSGSVPIVRGSSHRLKRFRANSRTPCVPIYDDWKTKSPGDAAAHAEPRRLGHLDNSPDSPDTTR